VGVKWIFLTFSGVYESRKTSLAEMRAASTDESVQIIPSATGAYLSAKKKVKRKK